MTAPGARLDVTRRSWPRLWPQRREDHLSRNEKKAAAPKITAAPAVAR